MSRRLIALVTIVCATALSGSAVAAAHGGGHHRDGDGKRHHVARAGGLWGTSLGGVAERLGVTKDALKDAVKVVAAEQRAAREADPNAPKPDRAARKAAWINGVAAKLGKTPNEVAAAVRAERSERHGDCKGGRHHRDDASASRSHDGSKV